MEGASKVSNTCLQVCMGLESSEGSKLSSGSLHWTRPTPVLGTGGSQSRAHGGAGLSTGIQWPEHCTAGLAGSKRRL
jgi:hypothetical protein